jgi:hypothetical protein
MVVRGERGLAVRERILVFMKALSGVGSSRDRWYGRAGFVRGGWLVTFFHICLVKCFQEWGLGREGLMKWWQIGGWEGLVGDGAESPV